ncbi:5-(carboxyamino)imidazole ribonucleotide synthase [Clostridium cellulovorans]|uniref:N5-carboxyaminoimidazole ribonucleotide synthase n=1 Tax=Clostridium cellulovorans (strain ATCC 35296 / DSM 3052 / OCM 3 / 743B) TaxID=573061 RepID=D9SVN7_CLOC7|nr:5-(carboxyamino)imidazole ribonucleotide synthase [Clostridium cellulovorans]ADL53098.1 phosphoribosylaminoimidazole carboxylase, ATPase subunit [Clostridium cellulovorans 743B]
MNKREIVRLNPPSNIGIIGGGQLGRMLTVEAKRMGYNVIILDPKPNSPAAQVADKQITAEFTDINALRKLAEKTDVLTYEFEHIDVGLLNEIESKGYKIYPSSKTLKVIQNKYVQKSILKEAGIKVPAFYLVNSLEELRNIFYNLGEKIILKTCKGGYDGKGNIVVKNIKKLEDAYKEFSDKELMVEEFINYTKEVSIIVAKNHEDITFYPIAENNHKDSILINSIIPAKISKDTEEKIIEVAKKVVETLDDFGVFCIEFFIDTDLDVLVNEIAPRPHNSGHYSIEGCTTSQYEQLIRIVTGMPLGSTKLRLPCVMYNILGSDEVQGKYCINGVEEILDMEDCYFHLYGKEETSYLKKIGHITALADCVEMAERKAKKVMDSLVIKSLEVS